MSEQQNINVFIIGNTGAGKSTIADQLAGYPLEIKEERGKVVLECLNGPFKIGHQTFKAETQVEKQVSVPLFNIIDTPGFLDTGQPDEKVNKYIRITQQFKTAQSALLILVVSHHDFNNARGQNLKQFLKQMNQQFKSLDNILNSTIMIITKSNIRSFQFEIMDFQNYLKETVNEDSVQEQLRFINHMIESNQIITLEMAAYNHNIQQNQLYLNYKNDIFQTLSRLECCDVSQVQITLDDVCKQVVTTEMEKYQRQLDLECLSIFSEVETALRNAVKSQNNFDSFKKMIEPICECQKPTPQNLVSFLKLLEQILTRTLTQISTIEEIVKNASFYDIVLQQKDKIHVSDCDGLNFILIITKNTTHQVVDDVLQIRGGLVSFSEVQDILLCKRPNIFNIEVYSKYMIYADTNIVAPSCVLSLGCEEFFALEGITINLQGKEAISHPDQENAPQESAKDGVDGFPGKAGQNGGNLILLGKFIIESPGQKKIKVNLQGGRGGNGQNGQDGSKGKDGTDGQLKHIEDRLEKYLVSRKKISIQEKESLGQLWHVASCLFTFNDQFREEFRSSGNNGENGGNGGKGGDKGFGGLGGRLVFCQERQDLQNLFFVNSANGIDGYPGTEGEPGMNGKRGSNAEGVYVNEIICPLLQQVKEVDVDTLTNVTGEIGLLVGEVIVEQVAVEAAKKSFQELVTKFGYEAATTLIKSGKTVIQSGGTIIQQGGAVSLSAGAGIALSLGGTVLVQGTISGISKLMNSFWEVKPTRVDLEETHQGKRQTQYNSYQREDRFVQDHSDIKQYQKIYNQFISIQL